MLHCNFDFILLMLNCGTPTGNLFSYSLSLTLCCCMCMYCAYKLFMLWVLLVSISLREYLVPLYCLLASYLTVSFYLSPHYVGVTLSSLLLVFLLAAFLQCLSKARPTLYFPGLVLFIGISFHRQFVTSYSDEILLLLATTSLQSYLITCFSLFVLNDNIFRFRSFSHLMFGIFIKTVVISRMIIEWLIDILKVSLSIQSMQEH